MMINMRAWIAASLPLVALLFLLPAAAEEAEPLDAVPYGIQTETTEFESSEFESSDFETPEFEEVDPPYINYEDYAGPDPVLEGTAPPARDTPTAGQQRIQELRDAMGEGGPAEGTPPPDSPDEFGARSVFETIAALSIVLGLIVLSLWAVRRFGVKTPLLAGANLGQVIGRVHLSPKASLHFVRTGGKVLVVGVTQESVQLVETFDAEAFAEVAATVPAEPGEDGAPSARGDSFLEQLRDQTTRMRQPGESAAPDDGDIANLRGDIERLQRMLRDATRE